MKLEVYSQTLAAETIAWRNRLIVLVLIITAVAAATWILTGNVYNLIWVFLAIFLLAWIPAIRRYFSPIAATAGAAKVWADAENYRYIAKSKPNYMKHFQPAVSRVGSLERIEQQVSGEYKGKKFTTYLATFRQLSSRQISRSGIRVYCVQLPKELPHIFMRNRQAASIFLDSLPRHFDDNQRVDLEGNFDKYFTVYTHRRTVTETLSILAPNVMETLRDANKHYDVEIVGNRLYLYTTDTFTLAEDHKQAFQTLDEIVRRLDHRLKSWKFTLPNNQHYPYMESRPGSGTYTFGHKYFNQSWLVIGGYNIFAAVKIWLNPDQWQIKLGVVIISNILLISVLLVFRWKYQLSRRNVAR